MHAHATGSRQHVADRSRCSCRRLSPSAFPAARFAFSVPSTLLPLALALLLTLTFTLALPPVPHARAATDFTMSTCDETSFRAAVTGAQMSGGGNRVVFACDGTIPLTNTAILVTTTLTIDGTGHQVTLNGGGNVQLFTVNGGLTLTLTTLTLTGGSTPNGDGGAIVNPGNSTVNVTNSTINGSAINGGAIANEADGTVNVVNSTLSGQVYDSYTGRVKGGGIYNAGHGIVNVTGSTIKGSGLGGPTPYGSITGGGIYNASGGTVNVMHSTISRNGAEAGRSVSGRGGGIANSGGTVSVVNSTISDNDADGGGGIFTSGGTLNVVNSTVSGNSVIIGGGGILVNGDGTVNVVNSNVSGNRASGGGGIANEANGTVNVVNSTFGGNYGGGIAGGIYNGRGTVNVVNSTFSGNTGGTAGGGIYNNSNGPLNVTNSLIVNNTLRDGSSADVSGTLTTNSHNLTGAFAFADPDAKTPQDHGGPTRTFALPPGSPALGAGDAAACAANLPTAPGATAPYGAGGVDQRGSARPDAADTRCDIGAFESQGFTVAMTSGDRQILTFASIFAPLTATVTSKDTGVTVASGTLTFTVIPGAGRGGFRAASVYGTGGCTLTSDTVAVCPVGAGGVVTAPPLAATGVGGFRTTASATPGSSPEATYNATVTPTTSFVAVTSGSPMDTAAFGQPVTLIATVTGVSGTPPALPILPALPTGMVTFRSGGTTLGTGILDATGKAAITTTALPVGVHQPITASYIGDVNFTGSSGTTSVTVTPATVQSLSATTPMSSGSGNGSTGGTVGTPTLRAGDTLPLTVVATYTDGTRGSVTGLTYTGYNPNVLSISTSGVVTALSAGATTVTITAPNGVTTTITITVSAGSGGGLMAPAPQPMAKAAGAAAIPGATPNAQPGRR